MRKIVHNIREATMYWDLYCGIKKSQAEYVKHMNQTKHFWSVTLNSYLDATRLSLCKIYDKQNKSLNIEKWLLDIQTYIKESDIQNDQLTIEIISDIDKVSQKNLIVKNLILHRNNHIVHESYSLLIKGRSLIEKSPLTYDDFNCLITQVQEILNKYSDQLFNQTFAFHTAAKNDFKEILDSIKYYDESNKFVRKNYLGIPI
jgi:hypothetical protein